MALSHMNWPAMTGRASPTGRDVERVGRLERAADGVRNMESLGMGSVLSDPSADVSLRLLRSAAASAARMCWPPHTASGTAFRPRTPVRPALLRVGGREPP